MKVFAVLNPAAGQETQESVRDALARRLGASHIPYEVHETVEGDRLGDIVRARLRDGFDLVVAAGGDGTVSGVVDGLVGSSIPLCIIPTGTGNLIARELGKLTNRIVIEGHTDAGFTGDTDYTNWELSADRANASRRELVAGGLEEGKIMRVVGLADAVPFNKDNPNDPVNRRISIIVMNSKAEAAISREAGNQIEAATAKEVETQPEQPP